MWVNSVGFGEGEGIIRYGKDTIQNPYVWSEKYPDFKELTQVIVRNCYKNS